jgi:hypothetical protein
MRTRPAWLLALALGGLIVGCGGDTHRSRSQAPEPSFSVLDFGNVRLTVADQGETFEVSVLAGSSLTIVADGGDATDVDIALLRTPAGAAIVTEARGDANPLTGGVSPQQQGGSVATAIVPSSPSAPLQFGTYTFRIASFDSAGNPNEEVIRLRAIINTRDPDTFGTLRVNVFVVGAPGLADAAISPGLDAVFDVIERFFGQIGIQIVIDRIVHVTDDRATRLGLLDVLTPTTDRLVPDVNLNRQSDEMDELFAISAGTDNTAVNIFLVNEFFDLPDLLTASGGQPGPPIIQGTAHSGVVAATHGDIDDDRLDEDLEALGQAIACELGVYLGAPPGCDDDGFSAAQAFVIKRNPAVGPDEETSG